MAVTASRRDAVIAFVQTAFVSPALSTSRVASSSTTTSLAFFNKDDQENVDIATAPLSQIIDLEGTKKQDSNNNLQQYQLVSPAEDVIALEPNQRLICIGDVHGDFTKLKEFLELGGVYDSASDKWCGDNTIVVQCGDVLDRGSEELLCFDLLTRLSQQAAQEKGAVILLWGNHEALNAGGMFHYTTDDVEYEETIGSLIDKQLKTKQWRLQYAGNQPARWAAYEPMGQGLLAHPLLANMKIAVKVGKTVCVHAGLTSTHLDQFGGITGMNQQAQQWMTDSYYGQKNNNLGDYTSMEQVNDDVNARAQRQASTLPVVLGGGGAAGDLSPVWMRDYSSPNDAPPKSPKAQQMMDGALLHLQADRMVMGHTVQRQINCALNGKAWRVDVGASKGVMNGTPEVLEVVLQEDGQTEVVSVLTRNGKVPAEDRNVDVSIASAISAIFS